MIGLAELLTGLGIVALIGTVLIAFTVAVIFVTAVYMMINIVRNMNDMGLE